jgi:hypothetical protein
MTSDEIRAMQRAHIVAFLEAQDFSGRVLDFGCGTQPYRGIVEANGGEYTGYNRGIYPGGSKEDIGPDDPLSEHWDVILSTQSTQYYPDVLAMLADFRLSAERLVLTYATNWPEVEVEDLHRFTRSGMERLLSLAGWRVQATQRLGELPFGDRETIALGYGIVAE